MRDGSLWRKECHIVAETRRVNHHEVCARRCFLDEGNSIAARGMAMELHTNVSNRDKETNREGKGLGMSYLHLNPPVFSGKVAKRPPVELLHQISCFSLC